MSGVDDWVIRPQPHPHPRERMVCLPYAGGRAQVFSGWPAGLPPTLEVLAIQLPGRAMRLDEEPFTRMEPLLDALVEALDPWLDRPFSIFGHSLGALVAFELARRLRDADRAPRRLYVAGHGGPQLPRPEIQLSELAESGLLAELERLRGTHEVVLKDEEMMQVLLPSLKADLQLYDHATYAPAPPLDCPIGVFGGWGDPVVRQEDLAAWSEQTTAGATVSVLPGDHFFLVPAERVLLQEIAESVTADASMP